MQHRRTVGIAAVHVGVDEHGFVKSVDRVVQGRAMNADLHSRAGYERFVMEQGDPRARDDALAEPLLFATLDDLGAIGISQEDPDPASAGGLLLKKFDERDMLLRKEQRRVCE